MYKVVWIARYRKGLSKEEGSTCWATLHGPPMKEVSPVAGYVQSHVQGPLPAVSGVAEEETLFDGYSCAWWNDRADYHKAMSTPAWQRILEDGPMFRGLDIDRYVQNHVVGPIGEEGETDDAENVFDMTQMWGAALKENVVIAPQLVGT